MASNYIERLRTLALNPPDQIEHDADVIATDVIGRKSLALSRVAALVAIGGAEPSFNELVHEALDAGASADQTVDLLIALAPIVVFPRVVEAAPTLALALGYDIEADVS